MAAGTELRVLVLAPSGRDARLAEQTLARTGLEAAVCEDLNALRRAIAEGAGAVLVVEEALPRDAGGDPAAWIGPEPAWSILPVVVLTGRSASATRLRVLRRLEQRPNTSFLERPVPKRTLISAVRAALEGRRRQYAVRELLEERDRLTHQIAEQLIQAQTLYDAAPIGLAMLDRELRYQRINPVLAQMNGRPVIEHLGKRVWDVVPHLRQSAELPMHQVLETGATLSGIELSGATPGPAGMQRHWLASLYPVKAEDGSIEGIGAIVEEITERRRAEERQAMLTAELHHRVKNMLATIQAMAMQTMKTSHSMEHFTDALTGRLQALARGHNLLSDSNWQPTSMSTLLHAALAPFVAEDQIPVCDGDAWLHPRAAMAFNLIVHELSTNASKYGALSVPGGHVDVSCHPCADAPGQVVFTWTERGGPPVAMPSSQGFGSKLIERCAQYELGGEARFEYPPHGFRCVIRFAPDGVHD